MSDEFLDFHFPCKECLVRAVCKEIPNIKGTDEKKLMERDRTHCLTLPYMEGDKHYHKMLLECWANLGWRVYEQVSKVEDKDGMCKELKVPIQFIQKMGHMAGILQYMVNSTSWNKGKLQKFDRDEINRKMKLLKL